MAIENPTVCEDTSYFSVGSFPARFTDEQIAQMPPDQRDDIVIEDTMRRMLDEGGAAEVVHYSMVDGEALPEQVDWEIGYAREVLPTQPGIRQYRFLPDSAGSLLTSPHFRPTDAVHGLARLEGDFGMRVHEFAQASAEPFARVTEQFGLRVYNKRDIPVGMSMVYFGLHHLLRSTGAGLREAVRTSNPLQFGRGFEANLKTFDEKFRGPMEAAAKRQIDAVTQDPKLRGSVELQFSAPAPFSLVALAKLGNTITPPMSKNKFVSEAFYHDVLGYMAGITSNLLNHTPAEVPTVVHECGGEINPTKFWGSVFHPSEKRPWSNQAAVDYAQKLDEQTAPGHTPREIHAIATPATASVFERPSDAQRVLEPFAGWPQHIRLAAGMARPGATLVQTVRAYQMLHAVRGTFSDVALACGAGRQRPEVAGSAWKHNPLEDLKVQVQAIKALRETSR